MKSLLIIMLFSSSVWAGGAAGNGGDIVNCEKTPSNKFQGFYVLDYLATYQEDHALQNDPNPLKSIWEDLKSKKSVFAGAHESLLFFFEELRSQLFTKPDYTKFHIWFARTFGLLDVRDEGLIQLLPPNCYKTDTVGRRLDIFQTIIREINTTSAASTIFHYDPTNMKRVLQLEPEQLSFLIVHEWLRNTFKDSNVNRNVNRLMHSQDFKTAPPKLAQQMLTNVSGANGFKLVALYSSIKPIVLESNFTDLSSIKPVKISTPNGTARQLGIGSPYTVNSHNSATLIPGASYVYGKTSDQPDANSLPISAGTNAFDSGTSIWLRLPDGQGAKYYLVASIVGYEPTFELQ